MVVSYDMIKRFIMEFSRVASWCCEHAEIQESDSCQHQISKFHNSPVVLSCCSVQGVCLPEAPPTTFWVVHAGKVVQIKKILSLLPPQWEKQEDAGSCNTLAGKLFFWRKWGCLNLNPQNASHEFMYRTFLEKCRNHPAVNLHMLVKCR